MMAGLARTESSCETLVRFGNETVRPVAVRLMTMLQMGLWLAVGERQPALAVPVAVGLAGNEMGLVQESRFVKLAASPLTMQRHHSSA